MGGHRTKFDADERVDLPDMDSLQTLLYESIAKFFGGVFGIGSGCLTSVSFGTADMSNVSIGPCVLIGVSGSPTDNWTLPEMTVAVHDPTQPWQPAANLNLSDYYALSGTPWLWFRVVEKEDDTENRMGYSAVSEAEEVTIQTTRWRKYVLFDVSISSSYPPTADPGWFRLAKVISWSGSVPNIASISAFDYGHIPIFGENTALWNVLKSVGDSPEGTVLSAGLFRAIRLLYLAYRHHVDSTLNFNYATGEVNDPGLDIGLGLLDVNSRGTTQIDAALAAVETQLAGQPVILFRGDVEYNGVMDGTPASFRHLTKYAPAQAADEWATNSYYRIRCRGLVDSVAVVYRGSGIDTIPVFAVDITNDATDSLVVVTPVATGIVDANFYITAFGTIVPP